MRLVGRASFGATVLTGRDEGGRTCSNGLPVVPASVRMLGRFQILKNLDHPGLCHYIELIRCSLAQNSAILISEHFEQSLRDIIPQIRFRSDSLTNIVVQVISALKYLHDHHICSGILRPNTVLCFENKSNYNTRLSQYGICHVTDDGVDMIDPLYMEHGISPEQLLRQRTSKAYTTFKTDIWALGILLLELSTGVLLEKVWSINQYLAVLETALISSPVSLYPKLLETLKNSSKEPIHEPSLELAEIIKKCLCLLPSQRPTAHELFIELMSLEKGHSAYTDVESIEEMTERVNIGGNDWKLTELRLDEAFFLWKLCGGSPENILVKSGVIKLQFPINTLPLLVVEDARLFGNEDGRSFRIKCNTFSLPLKNLKEKLLNMDDDVFLHSVELDGIPEQFSSLSIIVKEKDVTYQVEKMSTHLIEGRFYHNLLSLAVRGDIPPLVRGAVWSCLLKFKESYRIQFFMLNTLKPHASDRQLDVDIPRCHQYEELMTSPAAHAQLRRIIKGWLLSHSQYVYWQGCDSLAAPFLLLNFNDPAVALSCMTAFIQKYLKNFFLKDNSDVIQVKPKASLYHIKMADSDEHDADHGKNLTRGYVRQFYISVEKEEFKFDCLVDVYSTVNITQCIIFCNSISTAESLTDQLRKASFTVSCLHGDMEQQMRTVIMREFRSGSSRVLVTTDFLACDIDDQQVSLVINYDLPSNLENYIHRIGRSGRFGRERVAINFVTENDARALGELEVFYNTVIEEMPASIIDLL
ncbi:unnamed protein product [Auanema sp. JU1783]|nr:unnamed protein product [Auanema sp. JU1783]